MRALHLAQDGLVEKETPVPKPAAGEVLIRVHAAGVITTELGWYPTTHQPDGSPRTEPVPSHEFSGEIAELGPGVEGLAVGDEVYGMNDWFSDGALAQYCLSRRAWVAPKPTSISHAEAASVPISALTAWQGLFDRVHLRAGERLFLHGGAGAVGTWVIQLAKSHGAVVTTTASASNLDLVRELGADEAIDRNAAPARDDLEGSFDVVLDVVGGEVLQKSWKLLKPGGRMVTIASDSEGTADERTKAAFFIVEPRRDQLVQIADQIDKGKLRLIVDSALSLQDAPAAYAGTLRRSKRGKLVVNVP